MYGFPECPAFSDFRIGPSSDNYVVQGVVLHEAPKGDFVGLPVKEPFIFHFGRSQCASYPYRDCTGDHAFLCRHEAPRYLGVAGIISRRKGSGLFMNFLIAKLGSCLGFQQAFGASTRKQGSIVMCERGMAL